MNFKPFQMSAVVATAVMASATLATAPAQALSFTAGSEISFSSPQGGGVNLIGLSGAVTGLDFFPPNATSFGLANVGGGNTGEFATLAYSGGASILDLTTLPAGPINNFIEVNLVGSDLFFDLTSFVFDQTSRSATLTGFFELNNVFTAATGQFTTQGSGPSPTWSMTLTAIPTPALLPGLVAMGIGVIRKKKQQVEA